MNEDNTNTCKEKNKKQLKEVEDAQLAAHRYYTKNQRAINKLRPIDEANQGFCKVIYSIVLYKSTNLQNLQIFKI